MKMIIITNIIEAIRFVAFFVVQRKSIFALSDRELCGS